MATLEEKAIERLIGVMDPHVGLNVWDMGLVHDMKFDGDQVSVTFIPTSPFCPMGIQLAVAIKKALLKMDEINKVNIQIQGHMNAKEINEMLAKD
ncbi:MAG: DUF59 domain-containing protein [Thermoplasmata archaeon]|nr:DUF59 domain-containing protein [Thermoplasmata archaeon]MCK5397115.1 DUF59 domain-containing protein [Thermoplasmata archaeon]